MKRIGLLLLIAAICGCTSAPPKLTTGIWRGVLKMKTGDELPFNFEVKDTAGKQEIAIINGAEHFRVPDVRMDGDSVFIKMPLFDSEFKLKQQDGKLEGKWIKHLAQKDNVLAFTATPGQPYRFFESPDKPAANLSGRWSAVFTSDGVRDTTIGEFKQAGNKITGTFLTTTGDYRYLEGAVNADKLYLSCFDGGHAFLFTANIKDSVNIDNGKFGADSWEAVKNEQAKLPDAYSLTALKPGYKKLAFTFKDINGNKVSLTDDRFKGKVVIVQFMGSWCPNCMDETAYLVNYYKKYHPKGVEIVGLAYERTTDFARSQKTLMQLKNRFNVPYPLLITGFTNNKDETAKSLPMLANFVAFPTTVIIDKKGDVRKIHTGYSGPGTGEHYIAFVNEFEKLTDDLLAEK
ncbi:peroxiredoxin family protein [Mucilaginibacter boryungensis]|uniref:TlpA family protein disulfide reductase n=1 Tax=Mucilaginibacter boryungensis TaxID=768480 RepID=A0ABR9XCG5_9SPHI|nr:TlpA disulfide reductase family protein [Mucilaginibacter boryungensis]MBE9665091.1 TlpA family protein disulfide reductase [Mucilaginibacter boryungensis]